MTKRDLINEIRIINRSAQPEFLASFNEDDLVEYLEHLKIMSLPIITGDSSRYQKYFETPQKVKVNTGVQTDTPRLMNKSQWRQALLELQTVVSVDEEMRKINNCTEPIADNIQVELRRDFETLSRSDGETDDGLPFATSSQEESENWLF